MARDLLAVLSHHVRGGRLPRLRSNIETAACFLDLAAGGQSAARDRDCHPLRHFRGWLRSVTSISRRSACSAPTYGGCRPSISCEQIYIRVSQASEDRSAVT